MSNCIPREAEAQSLRENRGKTERKHVISSRVGEYQRLLYDRGESISFRSNFGFYVCDSNESRNKTSGEKFLKMSFKFDFNAIGDNK